MSGQAIEIRSESAAVVTSIDVAIGDRVRAGDLLLTTELMKMRQEFRAPAPAVIETIAAREGEVVEPGMLLARIVVAEADAGEVDSGSAAAGQGQANRHLAETAARHALLQDAARPAMVEKRHAQGMRTARENVADLFDGGSLREYGALAVAAQRGKFPIGELRASTPGDGIITGIGTVNFATFGPEGSACAVMAVDYSVMAGTQGWFHHKKIDRLIRVVEEKPMPLIVFAEGGGGRPNDVDAAGVFFSGLDVPSFWRFAALDSPRIAVVAGRCFAGNAAFAATADIVIATTNSNLGMGGPAMIEGGGLGRFTPEEVGPADVQWANGVTDILCVDEAEAVAATKKLLSYIQGPTESWEAAGQDALRDVVPGDRRLAYDMHRAVAMLADTGSVLELGGGHGAGIITVFARIEGRPLGIIANNPLHLGGAIDAPAARKAARFLALCGRFGLPVVSLCDTPGFMVGPDAEATGQVRASGELFLAGARFPGILCTIVLRKGYGLGAQAMAGGSFHRPAFTVSWPSGEFGAMGLEGSVRLGHRRELEAIADDTERQKRFDELVAAAYERGKAIHAAELVEFDAVIDPAESRHWIASAIGPGTRGA